MLRTILTVLAEVAIDLVTGKLEKREKLRRDLRGDSRQWGAFVRAKRPDATPTAPPSSRR
jgi:hypothetical protein